MSRFQAVIFDFDYTLADSSDGVVECFNYAFDRLGLPKTTDDVVKKTIGMSLRDAWVHLAGHDHYDKIDEFAALYRERADVVVADLTYVFDGVPDILDYLSGKNVSLGIVSTKFRYRIEAILKRERLSDRFDVIVGGEDVLRLKPDPEGLFSAIGRRNGRKESTLYVGDSVTDAETARRAGVPFAAVLSGVTPVEAFSGYQVHAILRNLSELIRIL